MNTDIAGCKNKYCEEYKNNSCKRAVAHKDYVHNKRKWVSYIPNRNYETKCELWIET